MRLALIAVLGLVPGCDGSAKSAHSDTSIVAAMSALEVVKAAAVAARRNDASGFARVAAGDVTIQMMRNALHESIDECRFHLMNPESLADLVQIICTVPGPCCSEAQVVGGKLAKITYLPGV